MQCTFVMTVTDMGNVRTTIDYGSRYLGAQNARYHTIR